MKETIARAHLESISPYGQSRNHQPPPDEREEKMADETYDQREIRTWRERGHYDEKGEMFIPPMALKNSFSAAGQYSSMKIKGQGNKTWTKKFEAGIMVVDRLYVGVNKDDVTGVWLHVPADGKRGGSKRVWKKFPIIQNWSGVAIYHILDTLISKEIFMTHLEISGSFIGLGFFRPANNGYFGRFKVNKIEWEEQG
ncbi:MAG: hypothetical protein ACW99U_21390 [Candidatus Thorarchaeota archaeon]